MEFPWISPVIAHAWPTFCYKLHIRVFHCPPTAPVLTTSRLLFSVANSQIVTVLPIIVSLSSIFAFNGSAPQTCLSIKSCTGALPTIFAWIYPPKAAFAFCWSWAMVCVVVANIVAQWAYEVRAHFLFLVAYFTL